MPGTHSLNFNRAKAAMLSLLMGLCSQAVGSSMHESSTADHYFGDLPVVLSATRLSQPPSDLPAALTVIDREMIRASGAMTIPEIMRLVPGMAVGVYSGTRATVSYHGMEDQYARDMQVLIDGRSVYDPGYGGVSWPDMPLDVHEIERIEIVRGPNAAAYGSNSFAGVINIITTHPTDRWGTTVKAIIGEANKRSLYASHAEGDGKLAYRISANHHETGGYGSMPDDEETHWLNLRGEYTPDSTNHIHFKLGGSEAVYQEEFTEFAEHVRELENRYHYQQIDWTRQLSPDNEIKLGFYHNFLESVDDIQLPLLSEVITLFTGLDPDTFIQFLSAQIGAGYPDYESFLDAVNLTDGHLAISLLGFKSHRYDLELQQTLALSHNIRAVWGAGLRRDSVEGLWTFHQADPITRDQIRLFGNLEWHLLPNLAANLGGMVEDFERKDPFFSPRLALNYHLSPSQTIRAGYSRAYRMPTLYEDFINQVVFVDGPLNDLNTWRIATENLEPQRIDSYELGYFLGDNGLSLDLRLFYEKLSNIIDEARNRDLPNPDRGLPEGSLALLFLDQLNNGLNKGAFTYTNQASARIRGFEVNLHYTPTPADLIFFGYSYMDAEGTHLAEVINGIEAFVHNVEVRVPDHTFSLLGSHRFGNGVSISGVYTFMDNMEWPGEGDTVPSYRRLDLRVGKDFRFSGVDGEVSLLAQNVGNDNIDFFNRDEAGRVNIMERRFSIQAVLNFR
jgi:iron complex outermembrane receptor protein